MKYGMEKHSTCKQCGEVMKKGKALVDIIDGEGDFGKYDAAVTMSQTGDCEMVDVLKCGWSYRI